MLHYWLLFPRFLLSHMTDWNNHLGFKKCITCNQLPVFLCNLVSLVMFQLWGASHYQVLLYHFSSFSFICVINGSTFNSWIVKVLYLLLFIFSFFFPSFFIILNFLLVFCWMGCMCCIVMFQLWGASHYQVILYHFSSLSFICVINGLTFNTWIVKVLYLLFVDCCLFVCLFVCCLLFVVCLFVVC